MSVVTHSFLSEMKYVEYEKSIIFLKLKYQKIKISYN